MIGISCALMFADFYIIFQKEKATSFATSPLLKKLANPKQMLWLTGLLMLVGVVCIHAMCLSIYLSQSQFSPEVWSPI